MSVDALIFWLFFAAWAAVLGLILFVQIPRAVGEVKRILAHISGLLEGSPLPAQLAKAEYDVARIESAPVKVRTLAGRAQAAVEVIRETPLVPPVLTNFLAAVRLRR